MVEVEPFDADPKKFHDGIEIWNDRIEIWFSRAAQAYEQAHIQLSKDALYRRWQYQQALAEMDGTAPPPPPKDPEYYFGKRDRGDSQNYGPGFGRPGGDPDQPAPVPRRPLPNAGDGEVELPLPPPL